MQLNREEMAALERVAQIAGTRTFLGLGVPIYQNKCSAHCMISP